MKLAIIAVCLLGFMLLECHSSPVQLVENHELVAKARALAGRQAATGDVAPAAPAAAVAAAAADEDDDDEDDDDDEPDLGDLVDDDDDDDDEEDDDDDEDDEDDDDDEDTPQGQAAPGAAASDDDEEDDDDDDYLDRIFDDILGDDDDDDDEDDTPVAAVAAQPAPVAAAAHPAPVAAVAPAQPAAVVEVLEEAASSAADAENAIAPAADDVAEGEQNVFYDEENTGIDTKVDIQSLNNKPLESTTAKVAAAAAAAAANEVESSDDDDDDDEDDITGALTGDDDDEDDDDTDDDDDDDDIVGDDVIEARRARGAEKTVIIEMPKDAFQERHNQFIDAIFARINRIVSDSYDPFKVRLATAPKQAVTKTKQAATATATKANKKSKTKKVAAGSKARSTDTTDNTVPDVKSTAAIEQSPTPASSAEETKRQQQQPKPETTLTESAEKRTVQSLSATKNRKKTQPLRSTSANTNSNANRQATKQKLKQTSSSNSVSSGPVVAKLRRAEGTLSGLASLRRVGNAKVVSDPEGRNSTIKSKFTLGPLTLKVEKSFKRGNVRNVKTATARTNEMIGRIKFSVVNDRATLVSIKVQQPKQVEVESKDNHDRTREFVWRRTPKIARLVSEKLKLAAESLFRPTAGVEVVRL